MVTSHNYYAGAKGVDSRKMHDKAQKESRNGITSWVHDHKHNQPCNEKCIMYTPNGKQVGI